MPDADAAGPGGINRMNDNNENTAQQTAEDEFSVRESVDLTPRNASFFESEGGLVGMRLRTAAGEEYFERVVAVRAFPVTDPSEFICIRQPDIPGQDKGEEIGMIRRLSDFDERSRGLIEGELRRRYFSPRITSIIKIRNKMGYLYWDVDTDAGKVNFMIKDPSSNIRILEDGRVQVRDVNGSCYRIDDPKALGRSSYKKIEMYL